MVQINALQSYHAKRVLKRQYFVDITAGNGTFGQHIAQTAHVHKPHIGRFSEHLRGRSAQHVGHQIGKETFGSAFIHRHFGSAHHPVHHTVYLCLIGGKQRHSFRIGINIIRGIHRLHTSFHFRHFAGRMARCQQKHHCQRCAGNEFQITFLHICSF